MKFYSKAKNLSLLRNIIRRGVVLDQISFVTSDYEKRLETVKMNLIKRGWDKIDVIVRSSSYNEDRLKYSLAGKYLSLRAKGLDEVFVAIDKVINSMGGGNTDDEIFIQPYITNIKVNGVAFGVDPKSNGNYMVIGMNDRRSNDMFVTSGKNSNDQLIYLYDGLNYSVKIRNKLLKSIVDLVHEVEDVFNTKELDLEFIVDDNETIYLLQVRPLIVQKPVICSNDMNVKVRETIEKLEGEFSKDDNLYGSNNILGMMPDWNPAEIIGVRPNKLAFSLYNKLILEGAWELGRARYGYKELKNTELMLNIMGSPYIDVRKSFNSLLPRDLPSDIAEKAVCYYLEKLKNNPSLHDKVEFEIVHSCYTFDNNFSELERGGLNKEDIIKYEKSLLLLTNNIICNDLIYDDFEKSKKLEQIREKIMENTDYTFIEKAKLLLDSCIKYGTIPFSGVARAAFIAEEFLRSFISTGVFTKDDYNAFKEGNNCITTQMLSDLNYMESSSFLKKYGHLRPGTYDITQKRYDEYNISDIISSNRRKVELKPEYIFSVNQIRKIEKLIKLNHFSFSAKKLISFISDAICYRENIKFEFTKNISEALNIIKEMARSCGYTAEDASYCSLDDLLDQNNYVDDKLGRLIEFEKSEYNCIKSVVLPEVLFSPEEIILFKMLNANGNYITNKKVEGETAEIKDINSCIDLEKKIVFIESADPGFDWMFSYKIKGFITKFGGANSHMAVRANELSIPAIIGVGEQNYATLRNYKKIEIDCLQRRVRKK